MVLVTWTEDGYAFEEDKKDNSVNNIVEETANLEINGANIRV